jgi:hypothetical protein
VYESLEFLDFLLEIFTGNFLLEYSFFDFGSKFSWKFYFPEIIDPLFFKYFPSLYVWDTRLSCRAPRPQFT